MDEKALQRAVKRAMENAGTLPAKDSVKLVPADWHRVCDLALSPSPADSHTAPAEMPGVEERIAAYLKLRDEMVTAPDERTDEERSESAKELAALFAPILAEKERAERNRDMWKGQCERQAKTLFDLRMQMLADEGQSRERG